MVEAGERREVGAVLYARVSSADQKADLDRQVARLAAFATENDMRVVAGSSPETQNAYEAEGSGQENRLMKPAASKQESPSRKLTAQAAGNKRL